MAQTENTPKITEYRLTNSKEADLSQGRFTDKQYELTTFDNNSVYNYVPIFRGLSLIQSLFDETPNEDDYLENALNCLRQIGNNHTNLYGYSNYTDDKGELCLPVTALSIEYVTDGQEDWTTWSIRGQTSQLYAPGSFISYKFLGDKVVTDYPNEKISVAYRSYKQDEEGLPLITEREAEACAYWWVWVDTRRKLRKGNGIAGNYLQLATADKNKAVNQARIPERYSQNFMDQLLSIVYSRDRKTYKNGYKPVKISN